MMERTLSIIKPDAISKNFASQIIAKLENAGLEIIAQKQITLTNEQAQQFYYEHKDRSFYEELVGFMTSGPVIVQVLEGNDAIKKNREIMGATNPKDAIEGTIRKEFGESVSKNAVHGSDSIESASREIKFFFPTI